MERPAGELGLGSGIPSFWYVLLIRLLCWSQLLWHLNHTIPSGFHSVCLGLRCLVPNWCYLRMVCARTYSATKSPRIDPRPNKKMPLYSWSPSSAYWLPSWGCKSRKHLAEPASSLFTISVPPQVVELSTSKVKLKKAPQGAPSFSAQSFGSPLLPTEDKKRSTVWNNHASHRACNIIQGRSF